MRDGHDSGSNDIDNDAEERINDALDAIVRGTPPAFHLRQLDPGSTHVIDQIGRAALADAPAPNPTFVTNLKETLMPGTDTALPLSAPAFPSRARRSHPRWQSGRAAHPARGRWDRISTWGMVEAAAILLVVVLAGTLLYGLKQPPPEPTHHLLAPQPSDTAIAAIDATATPDATPNAASAVATTTDIPCDVAETSATPDISGEPSTETLLPWPTSGDRPAIQGWPALLPEEVPINFGTAVHIETIKEITDATNELLACVESGDIASTGALLSDNYLRRLELLPQSEGRRTNPDSPRMLVPLAATAAPIPGIHVTDVRALPDGRVTAQLTPYNADDSGVLPHFQYIFVRVGDRWLVDEAIPVADYPSTPITITDGGFSPKNTTIAPQKAKAVNFTVHNDGTTAHTFTIPDLNIDVEMAPGDIQHVPVLLRPGVFSIVSTVPGDIEAGLTATLTVPAPINEIESKNTLQLVGEAPISLMSAPGSEGDVVATLQPGTTVVLLSTSATLQGVNPNEELWLYVLYGDSLVGWVRQADTVPSPTADATISASTPEVTAKSLSTVSVMATIQIDMNGVLAKETAAMNEAHEELARALAPYADGKTCRIGFALISSRSNSLGDGVELSHAVATMIEDDFPQLLPDGPKGTAPQLVSESIALPGTTPVGEVQIQLFLNQGCQPTEASPIPS